MAYRFRLIVLFFFSFYSSFSFSAINNVTEVQYSCPWDSQLKTSWGNPESLCNDSFVTQCGRKQGGYPNGNFTAVYTPPITCNVSLFAGSNFASLFNDLRQFCPPNSTPSGSQCICNEGYEEKNGNSCVLPEQPGLCESLAEKCETLNGSKKWITGLRRDVGYKPFKTCTPAGLVPGCNKGCVINSSGNGVFYKDQSGNYYFEGEGTISSETCFPTSEGSGDPLKEEDNPLPPSEPPEKPCKPGEYQGTVNGTKVCLPAKSQETIVKEETINNNDNSTTNINTTVKCENGKCTISETTTDKDSSGATTGESTKETQVSQSDFCAQNPGSSVCKSPGLGKEEGEGEDGKKSSFSGSCSSSFS